MLIFVCHTHYGGRTRHEDRAATLAEAMAKVAALEAEEDTGRIFFLIPDGYGHRYIEIRA